MAWNYAMTHDVGQWVQPAYGGTLDTPEAMNITDVTSARIVLLDTGSTSGGLEGTVTVQHSDNDSSGFENYEREYVRGETETMEYDLTEVESDGDLYWFDVRLDGAKYYMQLSESLSSGTAGDVQVVGILGTDMNVPSGYATTYIADTAYPDASR